MEAFKEYIKDYIKDPAFAKEEIYLKSDFQIYKNKYTREENIELTTQLTIRQIYENIKSTYKDISILQLNPKYAKLRLKLNKIFLIKNKIIYI